MVMDTYDLLPHFGIPKKMAKTLRELKDSLPDVQNEIGKSSFLYGVNGVGKTIRACHVLTTSLLDAAGGDLQYDIDRIGNMEAIPNYYHLFCWYPELLMKVKRTFDKRYSGPSEAELVDPIIQADFLVLDDIGPEQTTDWSYNLLYLIVGTRYNEELPTIFTSNLSIKELADKMHDTRITSRIVGMCGDRIFKINGRDKRID